MKPLGNAAAGPGPFLALPLTVGAVVAAAAPASAAPTGTFPVGTTPVPLNQPSDPLLGKMTPAADAPGKGVFGPHVAWPVIPVHAALARDGHLVSFGTPLDTAAQGGLVYDDWDVAAGFARTAHVRTATMHSCDSFCNGVTHLPDGRLLVVGGDSTTMTMTYDLVTRAQAMGQNLNRQRWYATALRLTDGRVLVLGGTDHYDTGAYQQPANQTGVVTVPETGTGLGAWTPLTGAASTAAFGAQDNRWW